MPIAQRIKPQSASGDASYKIAEFFNRLLDIHLRGI